MFVILPIPGWSGLLSPRFWLSLAGDGRRLGGSLSASGIAPTPIWLGQQK